MMNVHDFIRDDDPDLPDDNALAFAEVARRATDRLGKYLHEIDRGQDTDYSLEKSAKYGFCTVMISAAKFYEVEPVASEHLRHSSDFDESDFMQFNASLDHAIAQILLRDKRRIRSESVEIDPDRKERIRTQLYHIRAAIDSAELTPRRKARLYKYLDEISAELEKRRFRLGLWAVFVTVLIAPGEIAASYDAMHRLLAPVWDAISEAKADEDVPLQLPVPQAALMPPEVLPPERRRPNVDDEIPF